MNTEPEKYTLAEAYALLSQQLDEVDVPLSWDPCEETLSDLEDSDSDFDPDSDHEEEHPVFRPRAWTKEEIKQFHKFQKENKKPVN